VSYCGGINLHLCSSYKLPNKIKQVNMVSRVSKMMEKILQSWMKLERCKA